MSDGTLQSTELTEDLVREILETIFDHSTSLTSLLKQRGIHHSKFHTFLSSSPLLLSLYDRAQQARAESMAEETVTIADTDTDPQRARNRIDARKWYASKMKPSKFGDRIDLNVNQIVDIRAALVQAEARLLPMRYPVETLDAQHTEITVPNLKAASGSEPVVEQPPPKKSSHDIFS